MNNTFLIFPCFLTDTHYNLLNQLKDNLSDLSLAVNEISLSNQKLVGIDIHKCILDIKDVIKYRNIRGYKWNSYILSITSIKLNYISETIKGERMVKFYVIAEACDNYLFLLQKILESAKRNISNDYKAFPIGLS